jgi:predicted DsbA family dithiol-disulfide isomerase
MTTLRVRWELRVRGVVVPAIEVYADVCCPFTHVGLRRIVQRREELGRDDFVLRVRAWPLELVNGEPLDRHTTAEHVDALRSQVAPDLFAHFDASHLPHTSLPALALAAAAYRHDDRIGEAVSLELRDSLFEVGRDISRQDVLGDVAKAHGVDDVGPEDHERVRREWRLGQSLGVKGSPHFFCGDVEAFCPSLDISRDPEGHIHLQRDAEALDSFLTECFKT